MLETMLQNVRERAPLVHNITNYVTVNDCANILLACGATVPVRDNEAYISAQAEILNALM